MVGAVELTSLAEYLRTPYEPNCDFVSGRLQDRHIGEISHSEVQTSCAVYLRIRYPHLWTGVATRVRVAEDRIRVPDVMVLPAHAKVDRIVTTPPLVVIEVLSSEDRANDLLEKIADYLQSGIDSVWILDPKTGQAYQCSNTGLTEAKDGILRSSDLEIELPLAPVFTNWLGRS